MDLSLHKIQNAVSQIKVLFSNEDFTDSNIVFVSYTKTDCTNTMKLKLFFVVESDRFFEKRFVTIGVQHFAKKK